MQITKITPKKGRKHYFSIFIDGKLLFSLTDETILKFGLKAGDKFTKKEIKKILNADCECDAMNYAGHLLEISSRSENEITEKLLQKGYDSNIAKITVKKLKNLGYIDDHKYARDKYNYLNQQYKGAQFIKNYLELKGISENIIYEVLSENKISIEQETEFIKKLIEKKLKHFNKSSKKTAADKLTAYILRQGFSVDSTRQAIKDTLGIETELIEEL